MSTHVKAASITTTAAALASIVALTGCSPPPPVPSRATPPAGSARPAVRADPAPAPTAKASAEDDAPEASDGSRCRRYLHARGVRRGRELVAAKKYDEAAAAFDEAVRARPYDGVVRAERSFARLLSALAESDAQARAAAASGIAAELQLARALTSDPAVLTKIALNQGLAHEAAGEAKEARGAFIRAERLGSKEAAQKLGGAARCTVTVDASKPETLVLHTKWTDILTALGGGSTCEPPPKVTSEAKARALACGGCSGYGDAWKEGACEGSGPWTMSTGYMHCSGFTGVVQELAPKRYWVSAGPGVHEPLEREGKLFVMRGPTGYWGWVEGHFSGAADATYRVGEGWTDEYMATGSAGECLADEHADVELAPSSGCQSSAGAAYRDGETRSYYDAKGHFLGTIRLTAEDLGKVTIKVEDKRFVVEGNGCSLAAPFAPKS